MPSVKTLSYMACRTFHTVLNHFSFIHTPTFKLTDTAACLAFAICTVGGIRTSNDRWDFKFDNYQAPTAPNGKLDEIDGPVPPGSTWESMWQQNYQNGEKNEETERAARWDMGMIVRTEKTNMLVKVSSRIPSALNQY